MAIEDLHHAVGRIALEVHPDRIKAICSALSNNPGSGQIEIVKNLLSTNFEPELLQALSQELLDNPVSSQELCAMFGASTATASIAKNASSVTLVWSGPVTGLVPLRHTEQVLTELIDGARQRLFLVSFVAYNIASIIGALGRAIERGVQVRLLVERSNEHGGQLMIDSTHILKSQLPSAKFYEWRHAFSDLSQVAVVHAKCAVADGVHAFVTSANLTEAAMERNMELGVLLSGGAEPNQLEQHLEALITTKQIMPI